MSKASPYRRVFGQYFTPEPVVACCYALLAGRLPPTPRVSDPACGDGVFLRYASAHGLAAAHDLYGCDVDAELVGALHAAGLPNARRADGLESASLPESSFDLVVGNPPFGVTTGSSSCSSGIRSQPLASEVRFLLRALDLARPGGHIALVLPSGVLANERLQALRADLIERCAVLAVIALPRAAFRAAGTSAACSVLLLHHAPPPPDHQVFFALAGDLADLPAIVGAYHSRAGLYTAGNAGTTEPLNNAASELPAIPVEATEVYWLPQSQALARRMDVHYWRPQFRLALERLAARHHMRPLGDLAGRRSLIVGDHVRPSRGESRGAGLPYEYYQTREFMAAGYKYAAVERCDERAYQRLKYTAVRQGDILVSCAGVGGAGQGRVCLVTHRPGPSCTGDVFILRADQPDPAFLFLFLGSRFGRAQLLRLQNGVGTSNLSADELLQVAVPLVAPAVQRAFGARYAPIAAAHRATMAALAAGDSACFARARVRSEALLAGLREGLEDLLSGSGT